MLKRQWFQILRRFWPGLLLLLLAALFVGPRVEDFTTFLADRERIQDWLAHLGPWGPLGLAAISMAQVLFAPLPGYFILVAGGYLFGAPTSALFGTLGMVAGGAVAMHLSRRYGRPVVVRAVGEKRLSRWEDVSHADSRWTWFLLFLLPTGDLPWFLAGLSRLPVWQILFLGTITRAPSLYVASAIGAGETLLTGWPLAALVLVVVGLGFALYQYRRRFLSWLPPRLQQFLPRAQRSTDGA